MYAIFYKLPRYDNRDAIAGWHVAREPTRPNTYETLPLALRMLPCACDDDGCPLDIEYFVADLSDTHPRPVRVPSAAYWADDDIPF